jgi:hypothetical protein
VIEGNTFSAGSDPTVPIIALYEDDTGYPADYQIGGPRRVLPAGNMAAL